MDNFLLTVFKLVGRIIFSYWMLICASIQRIGYVK